MAYTVSGSLFQGGAGLSIDTSDLQTKVDLIRGLLNREQMEKLMHRTFSEVGRKAKTIIAKEAATDYAVTQNWVKQGVQHYELSYGAGGPVTCKIPIKGVKGNVGSMFHGYMLKKGRISAKILKKGTSRLPAVMKNQGGNAPFIVGNSYKSGLNGMAFTRRTKKRLPIVRVSALASPQPPVNRSSDSVADQLLDYAGERLDHNFNYLLSTGFK